MVEKTTDPHELTLEKAYKKVKGALDKSPTGKNIDAAEKARKALDAYRAELATRDNPERRRFKNLSTDVLEYLKGEGWKIEKSKLNEDKRKIPKEPDGTFTKASVDEYARLALTRLDGSDTDEPGMADKVAVETDIAREKLKKITLENQIEAGKWVLKSEVEQKHTAKLALFLNAIDCFVYGGKIEEGVEMVRGDREKAPDLKAFIKKEFRGLLGEYARRPVFTVPVRSMVEAEEFIENELKPEAVRK